MKSKSLQVFRDNIMQVQQDLQLLDVSLLYASNFCKEKRKTGNPDNPDNINVIFGKEKTHLSLNHPNNSSNINRIFAATRSSVNQSAIVSVYKAYSKFLADIVVDLAYAKPMNLVTHLQKDNNMLYKDIIELGSYDKIIEEMANRVYRKLQSKRSDSDLINALTTSFDLNIPQDQIDNVKFYLDIRHLIIHNKGRADNDFLSANNMRSENEKVEIGKDNKIKFTYNLANKMLLNVFRFTKLMFDEIDSKILNPVVNAAIQSNEI